jgi:hypothetical protein
VNAPRGRPGAEWIADIRAQNRARAGTPSVTGLGQAPEKTPAWKAFLVVAVISYLAYKLLPR